MDFSQLNPSLADINKDILTDIKAFKWDLKNTDYNFWLTLAILLYPRLLKEILIITEMNK